MMIRDSGSNMVRACNDWEIPHFSCVGHSLHLVVGPLLVDKKKRKHPLLLDNEEAEEVEDIFDDDDESWSRSDTLEHMRNVVDDFRKATKFFKNSTKGKELLNEIQDLQNIDVVLNVKLDVRTRWNSTYHMISRMIKMMSSIVQKGNFYKSRGERKNSKVPRANFPN